MPNSKKLIIDGAESSDIWHFVDDETPLAEAPAIISLTRLHDEGAELVAAGKKLGVILRAGEKQGEDVHALKPFSTIWQSSPLSFRSTEMAAAILPRVFCGNKWAFAAKFARSAKCCLTSGSSCIVAASTLLRSMPMSRSKPLTKPWAS